MEQVILIPRTGPTSIHHSMTSTSYSEVPKGELLIVILVVRLLVLPVSRRSAAAPAGAAAEQPLQELIRNPFA